MKTRSALLVAFMIIVPAVAMFSHRIPPDVRRSIREQVARLAVAVQPAQNDGGGQPVAGVAASVTTPAAGSDASSSFTAAPGSAASPLGAAAGSDDVTGGLARLGAVGFECRPVAGAAGAHVASCSVPLDGSGQLLRVFHVTGADAHSASAALLEDVAAWRDRARVRQAAAGPDRGGASPLRF